HLGVVRLVEPRPLRDVLFANRQLEFDFEDPSVAIGGLGLSKRALHPRRVQWAHSRCYSDGLDVDPYLAIDGLSVVQYGRLVALPWLHRDEQDAHLLEIPSRQNGRIPTLRDSSQTREAQRRVELPTVASKALLESFQHESPRDRTGDGDTSW